MGTLFAGSHRSDLSSSILQSPMSGDLCSTNSKSPSDGLRRTFHCHICNCSRETLLEKTFGV